MLLHGHDNVAPLAQGHGNDTLGMTEEQLRCMVRGRSALSAETRDQATPARNSATGCGPPSTSIRTPERG